jgi:hypothetical protein
MKSVIVTLTLVLTIVAVGGALVYLPMRDSYELHKINMVILRGDCALSQDIVDQLASDDVGDIHKGPSIRQIINAAREAKGKPLMDLRRPADWSGEPPP